MSLAINAPGALDVSLPAIILASETGVPVRASRSNDRPLQLVRAIDETTKFIQALQGCWFPDTPVSFSVEKINNIVSELSKEAAYTAAEDHANGFQIPRHAVTADLDELTQLGSIEKLILHRQQQLYADRFNSERCREWLADDPEFNTLIDIATCGAVIDVPGDFVPTSSPESPRLLVQKLQHTFSLHAFGLWQSRQALLLPLAAVSGDNWVHFSPLHWTPKPGKPEGRFICDLSNSESGYVVNDASVKSTTELRYGKVSLPDIHEIIDDIFVMAERSGSLENVRLWKEDIVGAFNHFNFEPKSARYLAFQVEGNTVLILFTGVFGWQGSPAVWAVFSRALLRAARGRLHGLVVVYVDDFIGIADKNWASSDQARLQEILFGVFGPNAVNLAKSVLPCQVCDVIGWTVDLIRRRVYPNEKGRRKLVAAFHNVSLDSNICQRTYEKLASLASRYSRAIIGARPFVQPLYRASNRRTPTRPCSETKACIIVWRALSLLLLEYPEKLAVPLVWLSSRRQRITFIVTTDAGPLGLGIVIRLLDGRIIAFASLAFPFKRRHETVDSAMESKYQNCREFLGVVLAILCCHQLCRYPINIKWVNDNASALSWADKNRSNSKSAQWAFLCFTWLQILGRVRLEEVEHIPGTEMGVVDDLSRFKPTPDLEKYDNWSSKFPRLLTNLLSACDPSTKNQLNLLNMSAEIPRIINLVEGCLKPWPVSTTSAKLHSEPWWNNWPGGDI